MAPALARRLQALAEPNTVLITESTQRQVGTFFELEDAGAQPPDGASQRIWRVVSERRGLGRFEALRSGATPMIGREEEIALLVRLWSHAKAGNGHAVLLSGEAGVGKSRLTAEFEERIGQKPHHQLRYFCSPYHQNSALYPIIAQLERAAGFGSDDSPELKFRKFEALITPLSPSAEDTALLADLLSLAPSAAYPPVDFTPQHKKEKTFAAWLRQLEGLSGQRPVLIVFEDLQWVDPTSRELLDLIIERLETRAVLLIATFRPEYQPPWTGQPGVTAMSLSRLTRRDAATLVYGLAGPGSPLPNDVADRIVERSDGVPLYVEELTWAVLEQAAVGGPMTIVPGRVPPVPDTLHASLIARLDRLGTAAKEVAQIGAVLGRDFSYQLIHRIARRPDLDSALGKLADAGLLFCRGLPPASSYLFKHALVQDAIYGNLLRRRRQQLHGRIAATLEREFTDLVERQPELLAHHLTDAGDAGRAAAQWLKAGQHAAARSAHIEAIANLERGVALLPSMPDTPERDSLEIELQLALGMSSIRAKSMISSAVRDAYSRASELAEKHGDVRRLFQAVYGVWQHNVGSGRISAALPLAERLLSVTERDNADAGLRLQAHHAVWTTFFVGGELVGCREHCEIGHRYYDPERYQAHRDLYGGHDAGVCAWTLGGQVEWLMGHADTALASLAEALALAERISHPPSLVFVLSYAALLHVHRGEAELVLARLAAAEAVAAEQRLPVFLNAQVLRGAALFLRGDVGDAVVSLGRGFRREGPAECGPSGFLC